MAQCIILDSKVTKI